MRPSDWLFVGGQAAAAKQRSHEAAALRAELSASASTNVTRRAALEEARAEARHAEEEPVDFKTHHLVRAYLRSLRPSNCVNFWCNESFFA